MSLIDTWPQVPVLKSLPETALMGLQFDPARLVADVKQLTGRPWAPPKIVSGEGLGDWVTILDWRTLSLRSIGGDGERTDPGGPALQEFADTPWLDRAPYIAESISRIPAPLQCVRLMSLGAGAHSPVHADTKLGLPWGHVRLHVPVVTTPGAVLLFGDTVYRWQPGTLWYADFTRMHSVQNTDAQTRIHLVIDCHVTTELLALLPEEFQTAEVGQNAVWYAPPVPLSDRDALRCRFDLPTSFRSFEEADGEFLTPQATINAAVDRYDDGLALYLNGSPEFALVPVGDGEFRFAGWTMERTIQVATDARSVTLRTRAGDQTHQLELPSRPLQ